MLLIYPYYVDIVYICLYFLYVYKSCTFFAYTILFISSLFILLHILFNRHSTIFLFTCGSQECLSLTLSRRSGMMIKSLRCISQRRGIGIYRPQKKSVHQWLWNEHKVNWKAKMCESRVYLATLKQGML